MRLDNLSQNLTFFECMLSSLIERPVKKQSELLCVFFSTPKIALCNLWNWWTFQMLILVSKIPKFSRFSLTSFRQRIPRFFFRSVCSWYKVVIFQNIEHIGESDRFYELFALNFMVLKKRRRKRKKGLSIHSSLLFLILFKHFHLAELVNSKII